MGDSAEKRKNRRVELKAITIQGKLYNVVRFKVKDLSWGGLNILSNFQAEVGRIYTVYLFQDGRQQDFEIEVLRAEVESIVSRESEIFSSGLLYSIASRFVRLDARRNAFLHHFLEHRESGSDVGVIPDAPEGENPPPRKP
jgi:hypothetical protein